MRAPFNASFNAPFHAVARWWSHRGNGNGNGHGDGDRNGNGHLHPAPHDAPAGTEATLPEQPWLAHLDRERIPRSLHYPTTTLGRLLDQAVERFGDNEAVVYNTSRCTYRDLLIRVNRVAGGLARIGVRKGDRVVLALPNCPEYVVSFFAIQKLGAIVVNAGPLMGVDDLKALMALTTPHVVIGLDLQASQLVGAAHDSSVEHFVWVSLQSYQTLIKRMGYQYKLWQSRGKSKDTHQHTTLAQMCEAAPAKPPTVEPAIDAIAVLQPTSGTTGALKLAQLSHRNLLSNAMQVAAWMGASIGQERVLTVVPMFHVYGLTTGLINPIFCAFTIVLITRFDAEQTLDTLLDEKPSVFPLVPAICDALSNAIERRNPRPAIVGLRVCISGAAPLPREVAERFEKLTGGSVIEGYGLSETSPVTHANLVSKPRYGSIGLPLPDTKVRIVDLDNAAPNGVKDVAIGQPGEMLISGPQVMSGYFRNAEETARVLWTDEMGRVWLRTGDIVRMDEDGFFQVLDRRKDMIIRAGLKVYPAKVEKVLKQHAGVADVAVVGRAHAVHTEEVVAFVVPSSAELDRAAIKGELQTLCRQHLAPYEVPSKFEFNDIIPRSVLGKALKKELR
ncbi:MAG: AMP-binding protein, partial [Tepidisphaeraceae bacterium]